MKRALWIVLIALVAVSLAARWAWQRYEFFLDTPLEVPEHGVVFTLEQGATGRTIVSQMVRQGFSRDGWEWKVLMRLEPRIFRAGEYRLTPGIKPREALDLFASGKVVQYRLTIVEGWTFRQLAGALATDARLRHEPGLLDEDQWPELAARLGIGHLEGWFFPETYLFTRGDSDFDLLSRAHAAMQTELAQAWDLRAQDLPLSSPYELLILASIIERETALDDERAQVAGVFVRRLQKGMKLQTDPTVIYGLGKDFDGNLRKRDLLRDTPYNTYTRRGLPPTPIALPGRASLRAAAQPAPGDALYFVADGSGGHTFSATLEEHQAAVRKLLGKN